MNAPQDTFWTNERVELLKEHYGKMPMFDLMSKIGAKTRGQIMGKANRIGLLKKGGRPAPTSRGKGPKELPGKRTANYPDFGKSEAPSFIADEPLVAGKGLSYFEAGRQNCKAILGKISDWTVCGDPTINEGSWCRHHAGKYLNRTPPKKPVGTMKPSYRRR